MTFWILALGMAAVSALILVLAMARGRDGATQAAKYDLMVYRAQLSEVDKDRARGLIGPEDADRAKVEISRKILEADRALASDTVAVRDPRAGTWVAGGLAALTVVVGGAVLYDRLGAPGYPDLPLSLRLSMAEDLRETRPSQQDVEEQLGAPPPRTDLDPEFVTLVDRLRSVVAERPGDPQGLMLLARNEAAVGNYAAAHAAQARLVQIKGDSATAADWADLAELLVMAAGGYVSPEAEQALEQALARDPRNPPARYYSGLMFVQTGRPDLAFRFWQSLLQEGPPGAPWIAPIRAQIMEIAQIAGHHTYELPPEGTEGAGRGPTAEQIDAAQDLDPAARMQMIQGMVEGLAARLATEGGTVADWARLIRAYGVLGQADRVAPVVQEARMVFAADPAALAEIAAAARDAGLQ